MQQHHSPPGRPGLTRRQAGLGTALLPLGAAGTPALAQARRDQLTLAMVLEPPGLDPTTGASAAIAEIVHYNVFEGLTKIMEDGSVHPLLAETWSHTPDGRTYRFTLKPGLRFSDGQPCDAAVVKAAFDRARAPDSTNKAKKAVWDNVREVAAESERVLRLELATADALLPFRLGEATAVVLHPATAAQAATRPVGTGPYRLQHWAKGSAVTLVRDDRWREAARVPLRRVVFRFISDPAAQVAALLAGDVDAMPRFGAPQALRQFRSHPRFVVETGFTAGKGLLALNNRRPPLNDVRVRRALAHAIDRQAFISGALDGLARPIGSHFAPTDAGYLDLTGLTPHDPARARALLKEAGVRTPLQLTLTLPPPQYARTGGEIVAAQLAQVGVQVRIENVEWAAWLSGAFQGRFDMTLILHVEPLDYVRAYTDPNYYFGYDSPRFRSLVAALGSATAAPERARLWRDVQRQLAEDAVNVWIFNPQQLAVYRKGLRGLWRHSPIFANDLAAISWAPAA
jgi:peptide/nickel transport system substrate-binding protein